MNALQNEENPQNTNNTTETNNQKAKVKTKQKRSTAEKGITTNIASCKGIFKVVSTLEDYNPAQAYLKLPALQAKIEAAEASITDLGDKDVEKKDAKNARKVAFKANNKIVTKISNQFELSEASKEKMEDVKYSVKKYRGKRITKRPTNATAAQNEEDDAAIEAIKTNSTSQQSFDYKLKFTKDLLTQVNSEPTYATNNPQLTKEGLATHVQDLDDKNEAAKTATINESKARGNRNTILEDEKTGIVATFIKVKKYVNNDFSEDKELLNQLRNFPLAHVID